MTETAAALRATLGNLSFEVSKSTGLLVSATRQGRAFSLTNGPRVVAVEPRPAPVRRQDPPPVAANFAPDSKLRSLTHASDRDGSTISASFDGPLKSLTYRVRPDGWLTINFVYALTGPQEYFGVGFDYPEADVRGMRFLGEGPGPVYQNRLAGGILDVWNRKYNNTMIGNSEDLKPGEHFDYPAFKGFYAGIRWVQFNTSQGPITATVEQGNDRPVYVQVFTPKSPPANLQGQTGVPYPKAAISFLHAIPAVGSKFGGPKSTGPSGQPTIAKGEYKGSVSLYFGELSVR